jgi:mannitol-1-phosphate 5-dehydrogenase
MKKIIQFGAGNIGRSFTGQLFARNGYEVVFVDINTDLIDALNDNKEYRVIIKRNERDDETILVKNIRGIDGRKTESVVAEIADADFLITSVGKNAIPAILPIIASGVVKRSVPVDIIIAENVRNAADLYRSILLTHLPDKSRLDSMVGLVETSIGKMVPIMKEEDIKQDPVWVFAEEYNRLIVDKLAFKNPVPVFEGMYPVDNIAAYVDRKLFIHNLGHAAAAYLGYQANPDFIYLYQALSVPEVLEGTGTAMHQAAAALEKEYPADFKSGSLESHIQDLLFRFQNKSLGDTIYRVGRDLFRKLGREDRMIGAMLLAEKHSLPYNDIIKAFIAGCDFRATDEHGSLFPEDKRFAEEVYTRGMNYILEEVCSLDPDSDKHLRKSILSF